MKNPALILFQTLVLAAAASASTVAHWTFDNLNDSTANNHHLANTNTSTTLSGGRANFTGAGGGTSGQNVMTAPDSAAWSDTSFTVESILSVSSTTTLSGIVTHMRTGTDGRQWFFGTNESGVPIIIINPSAGSEARITSTFTGLTAGNTYYLAVAVDLSAANPADRITFYLRDITSDGAFQTSNVSTSFTGFAASSAALAIGSTGHSTSRLTGSIDEVRISDTKLGPNELLIAPIPEPSHAVCAALTVSLFGLRRKRA